jgi:hypothetical protein
MAAAPQMGLTLAALAQQIDPVVRWLDAALRGLLRPPH